MEMQPLPGSGGFSQQYPVAVSSGMPRPTYLRPLQQPLYETEAMPVAGRTELTFFQRALSQTMAFFTTVKSAAETNLNQPGSLAQPQQFLIAGFTCEIESGVTKADFDLIYTTQGALAGPSFSTDILGTFFYRTFFGFQLQMGSPSMGATVATMMFLIILTGVLFYLFLWQRRVQTYEI